MRDSKTDPGGWLRSDPYLDQFVFPVFYKLANYRPNAALVCGPTMPSGVKPLRAWKLITAV